MPIYEYSCLQCGERTEELQRLSDDPLTVCETCGGELKKLLSAPAFQFKGTGWYVTDYAKKDNKGQGSEESGGSSDSSESKGSSESGGSESKSETKSETKSDSGSKTESKKEASSGSSVSDSKKTSSA